MRYTDYALVLIHDVEAALARGWELWQGPVLSVDMTRLVQPMVRTGEGDGGDYPNTPVGTDDAWAEHPRFTRAGWQAEVAAGNVQRGYWMWVRSRIEDETQGA